MLYYDSVINRRSAMSKTMLSPELFPIQEADREEDIAAALGYFCASTVITPACEQYGGVADNNAGTGLKYDGPHAFPAEIL